MLGQERPEKDGTGKILSSVDLSVSVYVESSEFMSLKVEPLLTKVLGAGAHQNVVVLFLVFVVFGCCWSNIPNPELHSGPAQT